MMMRIQRSLVMLGLTVLTATAASAAERFSYSPDGTEVTDAQTGLIWRRCAEGQVWSADTCAGNSISVNWEGALARAKAAGGAWRLPNAKELASLIDHSRTSPAIDPLAFPRTPVSNFWSSTPYADYPNFAWAIGFQTGIAQYWNMDIGYRVRLVRNPA